MDAREKKTTWVKLSPAGAVTTRIEVGPTTPTGRRRCRVVTGYIVRWGGARPTFFLREGEEPEEQGWVLETEEVKAAAAAAEARLRKGRKNLDLIEDMAREIRCPVGHERWCLIAADPAFEAAVLTLAAALTITAAHEAAPERQ